MASQITEMNAATIQLGGAKQSTGRLVSLDAYRGFILLLLVSSGFGLEVLKTRPNWAWLANQVEHSEWQGCTFWDLIQPAFTFMVGVAMPFSMARRRLRGASDAGLFRHAAGRALLLIALSNIYSNWGSEHPHFQLINVLSQMAFGYLLCFFIMRLPFAYQVCAALGMLAGHWALFALFPGPQGAFDPTSNIGAVIDLKVLGYNYPGNYTTINFLGNAITILFGCWTGMMLLSGKSHAAKLKILGVSALAGLAAGLALEPINPMIKRLWTASFTFYSAGWVILMLAAFYGLMEIMQKKKWAFPFIVLGMNSLFIYSFGQIGLSRWLDVGLQGFTRNFAVIGDLGAIPQHVLVLAALWCVSFWLYRREIFIRI